MFDVSTEARVNFGCSDNTQVRFRIAYVLVSQNKTPCEHLWIQAANIIPSSKKIMTRIDLMTTSLIMNL